MDVLIVGHISNDQRYNKTLLGGPPLYQLPVFLALKAKVHIITATDEPSRLPYTNDCEFSLVPSKSTTSYKFTTVHENTEDRILTLMTKAEEITLEFVEKVVHRDYDICIISPIANEIKKDTMDYIASLSKKTFLDMQGIVREIDKNGIVKNKLEKEDLDWALNTFDVVKISESEFREIDNYINGKNSILIVTKGGNGYEIYTNSKLTKIKTIPLSNVVDSTGSGDIFLAAFAFYNQIHENQEAILIADKFARSNLPYIGIPNVELFEELLKNEMK